LSAFDEVGKFGGVEILVFGKPIFMYLRGIVGHDGVVAITNGLEIVHDADAAEIVSRLGERKAEVLEAG
jgi:hypothetical protein